MFLLTILFSILCYFHFNPFKHMWQGFLFWMVYFVCIFSSFRVFCIKVSRRRRKTVFVPQTNFLRLWHGKKNPWRYALKYVPWPSFSRKRIITAELSSPLLYIPIYTHDSCIESTVIVFRFVDYFHSLVLWRTCYGTCGQHCIQYVSDVLLIVGW